MSMPLARYYTADDVRALPDDGNRYETVHGELLVTPAPAVKHQRIVMRLIRILDGYLAAYGLEDLLTSPSDISFDNATLVQPDLFIADLGAFKQTWRWADIKALHLVIEIVSPSSARSDRGVKRRLYQEQRIPEYWVVDMDQQHVEVWTPDAAFPAIQREQLVWRHPELAETCVVDVAKLLTLN